MLPTPLPQAAAANGLSFSKDKIHVLLLEGVNDSAVQLFHDAGYSTLTRLPKALDGAAREWESLGLTVPSLG